MSLDELEIYQLAMEMDERVWKILSKWDFFAKDTVGKQWVKAVDSVAANLSEGYGRFFYKENRQFCYHGRGSLFETRTWLTKARSRGFVREEDDKKLRSDLDTLGCRLNAYIKSIGGSQGKVKESGPEWDIDSRDTMTNDASVASQ
jgi:four helix bundle protein